MNERDLLLLAVGVAAGLATMLGGAMALRFRKSIDLFLAFSSGAVIGVSLLDLLPEALELAQTAPPLLPVTTALVLGFAAYMALDRLLAAGHGHAPGSRGHLGPASLTVHSLMDGIGIGLAFQVSTSVGLVVALAVLAHKMMDGLNTVTMSLAGSDNVRWARVWLSVSAAAPLAGILLARMIVVPAATLALLMGLFAGFFLYVGAAELLPRAHDRRPHFTTVLATIAGLLLIWVVVRAAHGAH